MDNFKDTNNILRIGKVKLNTLDCKSNRTFIDIFESTELILMLTTNGRVYLSDLKQLSHSMRINVNIVILDYYLYMLTLSKELI